MGAHRAGRVCRERHCTGLAGTKLGTSAAPESMGMHRLQEYESRRHGSLPQHLQSRTGLPLFLRLSWGPGRAVWCGRLQPSWAVHTPVCPSQAV